MLQQLKALMVGLLGPLYVPVSLVAHALFPFLGDNNFNVIFIASGFLVALWYYLYKARSAARPSARGFLRYMFPRGIYLHPSAIVDYKFFVINSVFLSYVKLSAAVYSVVGLFGIADGVHGLLSATFGARPSSGEPSLSALIAYTVVMMVTADFAKFFAHYLQHKIPILWEFHKVHHSAEVLTPITVNRVHPVDVVVDQVLAAIMGGLVVGTFSYFYTAKGWVEITLANISVAYFVFFLVANLRHSHIPVRFGWRTSHFFCSPYMHQIHHSSERRHWDKNFSIIVSVWDGLFGTLYVPREEEAFRLGLSGEENHRFSSVLALYAAPFAGVMRRLLIRSTPSAKIE